MKVYDRIRVDQWFLATMGVLLFSLSLAGLFHGIRASLAAHWAWKAQYGTSAPEVEQVMASCRRAFVLYPWNYYFSIFASELAYYKADEATGAQREERLHQSELWCERGLMQNRYRSQLRRLKTRFLWDNSPSEAIAYWEAHTNWQYWEPYNHETLAGLYAKYGEFDKAARELKLLVNFPAYEATRTLIESEKKIWAE
jgi:hypothetical protein